MRTLLWLLIALFGLAAPAGAAEGARVYAASSLTEAMTAIAAAYAATGKPPPVLIFGASSVLARQIERGAPPGIFVSADSEWPQYLAGRRLVVAGSRRLIAGNRLVLVVPADRPRTARLAPGFDLAAFVGPSGRWTTGDPLAVPVGRYARQALTRLGATARAFTSPKAAIEAFALERFDAVITDLGNVKDRDSIVGKITFDDHGQNTVAVITKNGLTLAIVGGLFVLEAVSVIVQVTSFKLTGKRVFKMAPIHHHYEQMGWTEPQIVIRFWIVAVVLALAGLATLKLR